MNPFAPAASPRRFLLLPSMPTPNGGLHLGHIAGPYLRLDVLARHLRRRGERACYVLGTDPHDSYVLLKARQTGRAPEELARRYHAEILADLSALDISVDIAVDPLEPDSSELYTETYLDCVRTLVARGATEVRRERFLFAPAVDRYIVGTWLLGQCPECGADAAGAFCEACGACFPPSAMGCPRSRFDEGPLEEREVTCLYLRLSDLERFFARLEEIGVSEESREIVKSHVAARGPLIQLSQPGRWGVPWHVPGEPASQVVFNYPAFLFFSVACGALYGRRNGIGNAFDPGSNVICVASHGTDNTVPFLVSGVGAALEHGGIKTFDHFLANRFYRLEGGKFSTSRGHVIWAHAIVGETPATSDAVRYWLAKTNPEHQETDFEVTAFLNEGCGFLSGPLQSTIDRLWRETAGSVVAPPSGALGERLGDLLEMQTRDLEPAGFRLRTVAETLDDWVAAASEARAEGGAWLLGLSLLAQPLLPRFATALWRSLGRADEPTLAAYAGPSRAEIAPLATRFAAITRGEIAPCLPPTLEAA
ncbi:MAG TPA: class I tRNA ligase family protein [Thermoanaerobaculia bacterium]|nr:class I tRNA ligase family protein [Thermoanaerobaculia bacterium]